MVEKKMRSIPSYDKFFEFIREFQGMIVLVMHSQADPDAVGAAIGLTHLIRTINPNSIVHTLEPTLSALSHKLLEFTDYHFDAININQVLPPSLFVLLDTNFINPLLIAPKRQFAIIDHHIHIAWVGDRRSVGQKVCITCKPYPHIPICSERPCVGIVITVGPWIIPAVSSNG